MSRLSKRFIPSTMVEVVEIVAALGVAGSAVLAVGQYWRSQADRHVDQTFKFLERFEDERMETAQRTIDQLAANASERAEHMVSESAATDTSPAERGTMRDRMFVETVIASNTVKNGDVPSSILEITSFFNGLEVCIEQQLCDSNIAHAFLDTYATSFWRTYRPVIRYARDGWRPQFASGMERFVQRAAGMNR